MLFVLISFDYHPLIMKRVSADTGWPDFLLQIDHDYPDQTREQYGQKH